MKVETSAGEVIDLGTTETTPTISMTDYSRRDTDAFGVTTVVPRGFSRRMSVRMAVPSAQVDALQRRLTDLRAAEVKWTADERFKWLAFNGFYKSFEIDHATPPLSFCTLEVDGLAATEVLADEGVEAAPEGATSTLRLIQPVTVTGATLASSSVAETDAPLWSGSTTYAVGDRVIRGGEHRIFESLTAGNIGNEPTLTSGAWADTGPTNRWKMFDQALGTATTSSGTIEVTLNASITAVALLDVTATQVRVQATGYDRTIAVDAGAVTFLDVPPTGQVVISIEGSGVSVGTLLVGNLVALGITEASPTSGITDYSRKEVDDFGEVTIVERSFAKRLTARSLIRTEAVDAVANQIAATRGRPALWIGQASTDSLTIYGFFKDWSIEVGEAVSKLSLTVEGLSKATPRVRPANVIIPRGVYDPAITYRDGDLVQYEGSSWLYIAPVESSGNEPPTLPTEENGYWRVFARAGSKGQGITLAASQQVIRYDKNDDIASGPITLTATRQNSLPAPIFHLEGFDGTSLAEGTADEIVFYNPTFFSSTGPDNLVLAQAWLDAVATYYEGGVRVTARASASAGAVFDIVSLPKIKDGADGLPGQSALTGYLTNESHIVPCTAAGDPITYAGASGSFRVLSGQNEVTGQCTFAEVSNAGASVDPGFTGSNSFYQLDALTADVGTVTLRATYNGASIDKVFTLTKSRAALDGTSPPLFDLSASSMVLKRNANGTAASGQPDFVFSARRANLPATTVFSMPPHGTVATGVTIDGDTLTITAQRMWEMVNYNEVSDVSGATQKVIASAGGLSDTITVVGVRDGATGADGQGAIGAFLSNESFTYAVDAANQPDAVPNGVGNGRMRVFKGSLEVTNSCIFTVQTPNNLVATIDGSGNYTSTYLYGSDGFAYLIASYDGIAIVLTLTGTKIKQGVSAKSLSITGSSQTLTVDAAGAPAPINQDIVFRAYKQNTAAAVTWRAYDDDGHEIASAHLGDVWTLTAQQVLDIIGSGGPDARTMIVTATIVDGVTLTDTISVVKIPAGSEGAGAFSLIDVSNTAVGRDFVYKDAGGNAFNGKAKTQQGYAGANVTAVMPDQGTFMGLTANPNTGTGYTDMEYAFHVSDNGRFYRVHNGDFFDIGGGGYGSTFSITSDGKTVKYVFNETLLPEMPANNPDEVLYGAFAIGVEGKQITDITFVPAGKSGTDAMLLQSNVASLGFLADFLGNLKPGQLGQTLTFSWTEGGVNVSTQVAWEAVEGAGCSVNLAQNGVVSFNSVSASGYVRVTGTYRGVTRTSKVPINIDRDPAPASSDTRASARVSGGTESNSYPGSPHISVVASVPSGNLRVEINVVYSPYAQGNVYLETMAAYRAAGTTDAWNYLSPTQGSQGRIFLSGAEPVNEQGTAASNQVVGVGPGRYEVGIFVRRYQGAQGGAFSGVIYAGDA